MDAGDWVWIWLAAMLVFALGELAVAGTFFLVSFAGGAALAALVALLGGSVGLQWLVFVVGSGVGLLFLAPLGRRLANTDGDEAQEGANRWIGRVAVVLEDIPAGAHATGRVRVERDEWRAETDAGVAIPAGEHVEVLSVRGTRLVVAPTGAEETR
jgi:membrane protein implicated in regulation of membrane protease activity